MDNTTTTKLSPEILLHPISQVTVVTAVTALTSICLRSRNKPLMAAALSGACGGFIISTTNLGLEYYRRKRDYWNPCIGAGLALAFDELVVDPPKTVPRRPLYRRLPAAASRGVAVGGLCFGFLYALDKYILRQPPPSTSCCCFTQGSTSD